MTDAPSLPRRFYKAVSVRPSSGGHGVHLDERTLRTPGGVVFVAPTAALAHACADEWDAQGEHIAPSRMPVSQLAFAALDRGAAKRDELIDYIAAFGETDLCCHRADAPIELIAHQAAVWDPIVSWAREELGVSLPVMTGVIAAPSDPIALAALRARAALLDDFRLTALAQATGLAGSVLIGFALVLRRLDAQAAFEATALDNLWSLKHWGEDTEARTRLDRQRAEFAAIERYVEALSA